MKSGVKSSEFYLTVLSAALGIAVLFGVVTQEQVESLVQALEALIKAVIGLWLVVKPIVEYIKGRSEIKKHSVS